MTKLPYWFSARGFEFQSGLNVLRKAAQSGLAALNAELESLWQQLEDYKTKGDFIGERDDAGYVIWEQDYILEHEIYVLQNALVELRKAFAIAAYHHWERSVDHWIAQENEVAQSKDQNTELKKTLSSYKDFKKAASKIGFPVDQKMDAVVALVNTLKHNSTERYAPDLFKMWPEIFPEHLLEPFKYSNCASLIQLTDQHLHEVFDTISKCAPTSAPAPTP